MPDYVHYICPQFTETDINFQRVPTVDTSNPFAARWIPTADDSLVIIRFAKPRGIDFSYLHSMIHDSFMSRANSIVIPGAKLDLAMQLILTPFVLQLVERHRAFRLTTPIFVARGPALLFGISRWLSQHGISRKRRNNLTRVLIAVERSTQESKANSSHPSSREGHRCAGLSLRQFGVRRSDCRRHFPCPAELGSITPHAMHNHGEPSCQCDDGFFLPPTLGNVHRPCLQPRPFLHAGQHDLRSLIEQRSHGLVAT